VVVGFDENDLSVETKTTVDGRSTYVGPSWGSGDAELRICRVGATFATYKRPVGSSTWQEAERWERLDLPEVLQVGLNAYAIGGADGTDLTVTFEGATFAPAATLADCLR